MDNITKFLRRLTQKEQIILMEIMQKIILGNIKGLDIKKLSGEKFMYRIRKGNFRIIFEKIGNENRIVDVNYRGNIYK